MALTNPNTAGTIRVRRNAWLALLLDDRFDGTPEALRWLCYIERDTLNSLIAEEFVVAPPQASGAMWSTM